MEWGSGGVGGRGSGGAGGDVTARNKIHTVSLHKNTYASVSFRDIMK